MPTAVRMRLGVVAMIATALIGGTAFAGPVASASSSVTHSDAPLQRSYPRTIRGAYNWTYNRVQDHYCRVSLRWCVGRPTAKVTVTTWWHPSIPHWISDPISGATWWFKHAFSCAVGVAGFVALGGSSKVASILIKIRRLAKTSQEIREVRTAARELGGFSKAMDALGQFAKTKGSGVTAFQKARVKTIVFKGGSVIADLLGIKACFQMIGRVIYQ